MKIKTLHLKNFRNYTEETFEFTNGINLLTGANAQGKTNAGEAIFLLCTGYSPRANKDKQLVRFGESKATVWCKAETKYGDITVKIDFSADGKKEIHINDVAVLRVGELLGNINSVFFNPTELKLVQESPEDRRRFLNIALSQMSKNYFYALNRYNKILAQRNNLLKDKDKEMIYDTLPIWDMELVKYASRIICDRNDFLQKLTPLAQEVHLELSGGKEQLLLSAESGYTGDIEQVKAELLKDLKNSYEKDMRLGFTTVGPHRDDIKIILNGIEVKTYGSQGQQRTVALSIKLAEAELFNQRFGEYPILILDDVLSELDKSRQKRLINLVDKMQTILTCTTAERSIFQGKEINKTVISDGKIKKNRKK